MRRISKNLKDTEKIASSLRRICATGRKDCATVVGLYGELGAGKTTLTQALAKSLGIKNKVVSPTFVIMKSYLLPLLRGSAQRARGSGFKLFIHIDAYRLEKPGELLKLGWADIIADPKNLVLIEWPEKVADIMPEHIKVRLSHLGENLRGIEIA